MDINWLIQETLGLNLDWFNNVSLLSVKNLNMLLYSNLCIRIKIHLKLTVTVEGTPSIFLRMYP